MAAGQARREPTGRYEVSGPRWLAVPWYAPRVPAAKEHPRTHAHRTQAAPGPTHHLLTLDVVELVRVRRVGRHELVGLLIGLDYT